MNFQLIFYSIGLLLSFIFTAVPVDFPPITKLIPIFYQILFFYFFRSRLAIKIDFLTYLLIFVQVVGFLRNNNPNSNFGHNLFIVISHLSFCFYIFSFNYNLLKKEVKFHVLCLYNIILPIALFSILNFLLLGISQYNSNTLEIGDAVLLNEFFDIKLSRVTFPLISGAVNFSFIVGINILTSILVFNSLSKISKTFAIINIVFSLYLMLINDSRSTIFTLLILLTIKYISFKKLKVFFYKILPIVVLCGPLIFIFFSLLIVNFGFEEILARNKNDFLTGNSRFIIWLVVLDDLLNFKLWNIWGLGAAGSYISGASQLWEDYFQAFDDPLLITTHNVIFNLFYDLGYIGMSLYMINLGKVFYYRTNNINLDIPKLLLAFYAIQGIYDVPFGFYTYQNNCIFYLIFVLFYYIKNENRPQVVTNI